MSGSAVMLPLQGINGEKSHRSIIVDRAVGKAEQFRVDVIEER